MGLMHSRDLAAAGGLRITPDLIPDEAQQWLAASEVGWIAFFAPSFDTSGWRPSRPRGFVYAASTMG